jgi:hypothetical protein
VTTHPIPTPRRVAAALLALAALVSAACSQGTAPAGDQAPDVAAAAGGDGGQTDQRLVMSPASAVIVRDLGDPREVGPTDPVRITAARVDGDSLRVSVETGGGCARHVFRLAVHDAFMESNPVQVRATLGHDANGDRCRALLRADLAASLAPLADAYRRGYQTPNGVIVIRLAGWDEGLRYTF